MNSLRSSLLPSGEKCDEGAGRIRPGYIQADVEAATGKKIEAWLQWDNITARTAQVATVPFLLMQFPQIILNTRNLISGDKAALFAVGWTAQLSSLMGNLSLLSYFVSKKESGASTVQAVGVATTLVVLFQLSLARAMPWTAFVPTLAASLVGFTLSALCYANLVHACLWKVWIEILGTGGIFVLVQVVWSTFENSLPKTVLPGIVAGLVLLVLIILSRMKMLPDSMANFVGGVTGWVATILFMWSPVSQLYTNIAHPENLYGLSIFTIFLALAGNSLLIPRALFIRDLMWFTGCTWGAVVWGWGISLSMYIYHATNGYCFWGATAIFASWLGFTTVMDMRAYGLTNPFVPYMELILCARKYENPLLDSE